jgi:hypothetical protein
VSKFCESIDRQSGLRAAILRCNLFCGNNLEACLVPLYRAASLSASVIGNTTDTNNNFVSGDFGSSGLKGNGSTKWLNTGFASSSLGNVNAAHMSASGTSIETSGDAAFLGAYTATNFATLFTLDAWSSGNGGRIMRSGLAGTGYAKLTALNADESHFIGQKTSNTNYELYRSGTSSATANGGGTGTSSSIAIGIFCLNTNTTPAAFSAARMRMYSIGNSLTAAQALAFSNAVAAFNTALGRA